MANQPTTVQRIAAEAYRIWEGLGCPHGQDQKHWFQAEQNIINADKKAASKKKTTAPAK